jgi:hypothetical protein
VRDRINEDQVGKTLENTYSKFDLVLRNDSILEHFNLRNDPFEND